MTTITATVDKWGREWLIIPDDQARGLKERVKQGWREIPGVGHGYSTPITPDDPWYNLCAALFAAPGGTLAFIGGEGFDLNADRPDYSLLVSTCGVRRHRGTEAFEFEG